MPVLTYSLLRLGLFAVALVVLWSVRMGGWLLVVVAAVVAWALSYIALGRQRAAAAEWLAQRRGGATAERPRFGRAHDEDTAAEDAADDAARSATDQPSTATAEHPADRD